MRPSSSLLFLIAASLLTHVGLTGARVAASLLALSQHASAFIVGTLMTSFALLPMLAAVPAGRLIDRIGIVKPMFTASAAVALGCLLPGLFGNLPVLFLAAALIGTGFMVVQVAAQHSVGAISTLKTRATNFGWLAMGFSISGFCGPVITGLLIDHADFRIAFFMLACFPAAACAIVASGKLASIPMHAQDRKRSGNAFDLLRDKQLRQIYIVGTLLSSAWDLYVFALPIHGTRIGLSASTIGFILGCFSMATFTIRLAMPWITRRLSEWQILTCALGLASLSYLLLPLARDPFWLTLVSAALGFAVGVSQPNVLALLHQHAPADRGAEAVGLRVTIGNAFQVFLPLVFGGASAALGLATVFWSVGAAVAAGVPVARRQIPRK